MTRLAMRPAKSFSNQPDGLAQDVAVRAPADQRAEIGQDRVVQEQRLKAEDQRADQQDEGRDEQELGPVLAQRGGGVEEVSVSMRLPE
jgi:hypothetical protein